MTRLFPALAPVRTDIELVKSLKGLRVAADATLISGGRVIDRQSGEVQFTDGALSGICIFNLSAKAAEYINNGEISLDTALLKALYLATFEATKKWTTTIRDWAQVYGELSIMYEGRLPE
ncbi:hypothetical protein LEA_10880 [human gut metagenome]|uniref:Uncharacterized protein n=1 Tax=human gut metagenome TaxID=408170 RepID=K1TYF3_9ZZZZ